MNPIPGASLTANFGTVPIDRYSDASCSWWLCASEEFYRLAAIEEQRMRYSRGARWADQIQIRNREEWN